MSFEPFAKEWDLFRKKPSTALAFFLPYSKGRILDAGCGNGRNARILSKTAAEVVAVDVSEAQVRQAEKNTENEKNISVLEADFSDLPFKDGTFDAIFCLAALHHVAPQGQDKVLGEFRRTLKKKGTLCVSVWNKDQPRFAGKPKELNVPWRDHPRYHYLFDKKELEQKMEKNGFGVIDSFLEKNGRKVEKDGQNLCLMARK